MVRSPLVTPLIAVMVILMLLLPGCSRRLPTAPGRELSVSLLLRFPESSRPPAPALRAAPTVAARSAATVGLDTVRVSIFERIAGRDSTLIASETLPLTQGQSSFAIRIRVRLVDSYAIRAEVTGTRQRPGRVNATLQGIQFVGYTITDPAALQIGSMTLDMRDVVPLPRLFRPAGSDSDSLGWDALAWPAQYVVRDTLGILGRTTLPGFRVGRLSTGYRVRAELALGKGPVIGAFSEALDVASPPSLSRLLPDQAVAGGAGFPLVVEGTDFLPGAVILWNGEELQPVQASSSSLTADVPAARIAQPDTVEVQVRNLDGQPSNALPLQVRARPPVVTGITPDKLVAGGPDTLITVAGSDFQDGAVVTWNRLDLHTHYGGAASLAADVPAARITLPGTVAIRVRQGEELSDSVDLVIRPAPPRIDSLAPDTIDAGGGDTTLTLLGTGFEAKSMVTWNGGDLATSFFPLTGELRAVLPAARIAQPGSSLVQVRNDDQTSNTRTVVVRLPAPSLVTLNPSSRVTIGKGWKGGAVPLNLSGAHFQPGADVYWGTHRLAPPTYTSSSALVAAIPVDSLRCSGTVPIAVANPDGRASGDLIFTILYGGPWITSLTPASAFTSDPDFQLQVDGCDFQPGVQVQWATSWDTLKTLLLTSVSSTRIIAQVPRGDFYYAPGTVFVTVVNPDRQSVEADFFVMLGANRPLSALAPVGKSQPRGNPPGTLDRGPPEVAPNGGQLDPSQTHGGHSP